MSSKAASTSNAGASTSAAAGPSRSSGSRAVATANASAAHSGTAASTSTADQDAVVVVVKRSRGRPKGSKNAYTKSQWLSTKSGVHISQDEMDRNVEILQARLETSALLDRNRNVTSDPVVAQSITGKGKEKAQDPTESTAPVQQLPNRSILSIEYPGFIPPPPRVQSLTHGLSSANHAAGSSLDKALATLSPLPPPLGTPESALKHIAWVIDSGAEAIECRLGAPYYPLKSASQAADTIQESADLHPAADAEAGLLEEDLVLSQAAALDPHLPSAGPSGLNRPNGTAARRALARREEPTLSGPLEVADDFVLGSSMYKASIVGSVTSTNNPVIRVRRRKWRRKSKEEGIKPGEWTNKEYVVELVGTSQQTARFRYMADYAYEPDVGHVQLSKEAVIQANLPPGMSLRDEAWKSAESGKAAKSNRRDADRDAMEVDVDPALLPATTNQPGKEKDAREKFREQIQAFTGGMHGTVLRKKPNDWPSTANKTLALHAALMTMNTKALRAFKFDPELQEWECDVPPTSDQVDSAASPSTVKKSNLNLLPPSRFSQPGTAFPYLYRQTQGSALTETTGENGEKVLRWTYVNVWKGLAPPPFRLGVPVSTDVTEGNVADGEEPESGEEAPGEVDEELAYYSRRRLEPNAKLMLSTLAVPAGPHEGILKERPRLHQDLLDKLKHLFAERPIWTRIALANQFESPRDRQTVIFNKALIPQVSFTIIDGPWKDTLVRYGYDVRVERDARFYQRLSFRVMTKKPEGRQSKKLTRSYGSVAPKRPTAQRSALSAAVYGGKDEDAEVDQQERDDEVAVPDADGEDDLLGEEADMSNRGHIFDGKHLVDNNPTFCLADITDPHVQQLVYDDDEDAVADQIDVQTGWYTPFHWELIKEVANVKYKTLAREGREATHEELKEAVRVLETKLKRTGLNHREVVFDPLPGEPGDVFQQTWEEAKRVMNPEAAPSRRARARAGQNKGKARA